MRKLFLQIIAFILLLNTFAFGYEGKYLITTALIGKNMNYTEYGRSDEILDTEKSDLYEMGGMELRLAYEKMQKRENGYEVGINFWAIRGKTEYVGSLILSDAEYGSYVSTTKNLMYDASFDYIYKYIYADALTVQVGAGLGQRFWRRELSPAQIELYSWYSLRPQFGLSYKQEKVKIAFVFEYQYGFDAKMNILQNSENGEKSLDLGFANIVKISLPVAYSLNEYFEVFASYAYERQDIGASNSVPYIIEGNVYEIYEPKSSAINHYIKLGTTLKF